MAFVVAIVLAAFFVADIVLLIFVLSRRGSQRPAEPKPEVEPNKPMRWWGWLILILFAACWCGMTAYVDFVLARSAVQQYRSLSYESTEGDVVKSAVIENDDAEGVSYDVAIEYVYRVGDKEFRSKRIRYYMLWDKAWVTEFVRKHPLQTRVTVYYDPDDPADAILLRELDGGLPWAAMFLVPFNCITVGLLILPVYWFLSNNKKPAFTVVEIEGKSRVQINPANPFRAALFALVALSFCASLCSGFCCDIPPSLPVAGSAWGIVFVGMGLMYLWIAARKRAGKYHLILDPGARTLTLPEIVLGKAPKVIRFDEISKVDVENVTDDFSKHYALRLHWRNDTGKEHEEYLVDWSDKDAVDAFGEWLRTQIGLTP